MINEFLFNKKRELREKIVLLNNVLCRIAENIVDLKHVGVNNTKIEELEEEFNKCEAIRNYYMSQYENVRDLKATYNRHTRNKLA